MNPSRIRIDLSHQRVRISRLQLLQLPPFQDARLGLMDPDSPYAQNAGAQSDNQDTVTANQTADPTAQTPLPGPNDPDVMRARQNEEFAMGTIGCTTPS